jgi:hypothetical protein
MRKAGEDWSVVTVLIQIGTTIIDVTCVSSIVTSYILNTGILTDV